MNSNIVNAVKVAVATGGAGLLGGCEVGAHQALLDFGYIHGDLSGTSAGSIVSGVLACGKTPAECYDIVTTADYKKLIDYNILGLLLGVRKSIANSSYVKDFLKDITGNMLMGDVKIPLKTITSDTWEQKIHCWSSHMYPDMPVWEAIYSSMAIPYVFDKYMDRYVDGGVLANLPVDYLDHQYPRIGFNVHEHSQTGPLNGWLSEAGRLLSMMLSSNVKTVEVWAKATNVPIVQLPAGKLGFLDRNMTIEQKKELYQWGYNAVSEFLSAKKLRVTKAAAI